MNKDSYVVIKVNWKHGFKHNLYCRGFQIKSYENDLKNISWVKNFEIEEMTEEKWTKLKSK